MKVFILTRKRLAVLATALAVVLCLGIFRVSGNGEAVAANTTERHIPIYCVDTDSNKVSISFDAAWGNEQTQSLLDTLDEYNVKATFFLVGDWVRNYPDDVKAIAKAGHDVGNHSNTHPYMTQISKSEMQQEIETCNQEVEALTGKRPTLFRPPYGDYDNNVVDTVNGLDMYCVQWDVDSLDWKGLSAEEMCSRIKNNIKSGSIVLMHNGGENTPAALPSIIECIRDLGYEIVPISELLPKGDYTTDHTGMMIPSNTNSTSQSSSKTAESSAENTDNAKQTAAEMTDTDIAKSTQSNTASRTTDTDRTTDTNTSSSPSSALPNTNSTAPTSPADTYSRENTTSTNQGLKGELDNLINNGSKKK